MRYLLSIILGLLIWITPAQAEFTNQEKLQLRAFHAALGPVENSLSFGVSFATDQGSLERTMNDLSEAVRADGWRWTMEVVTAWKLLSSARLNFDGAWDDLFNATPANDLDSPPCSEMTGMTRAACVDRARQRFGLGKQYFAQALSYLQAARRLTGKPSAYYTRLDAALVAHARTTATLNSINLSFSFANWRPLDFPQIIGPHGAYVNFLNRAAFARARFQMSAGGMRQADADIAVYMHRLLLASAQVRHATLKVAMIPFSTPTCQMNRFHLAADSARHLTAGGSVAVLVFRIVVDATGVLLPFDNRRLPMLADLAYGWTATDRATWEVLDFPDPTKLGRNTNRALEPVSWGPVLCP